MAQRYGRNKRRAARQEIEALQYGLDVLRANLNVETRRRRAAEYTASNARQRAMQDLIDQGLPDQVEYTLRRIADEIARQVPPKLVPHATKVLEAARHSPKGNFLAFEASVSLHERAVSTIHGKLGPIDWSMVLA